MKVNKVKFEENVDPDHDITLFGISTSLQDFQLAHFINKKVGTRFAKADNIPIYDTKKGSLKDFSFYFFQSDIGVDNYLFANTSDDYMALRKLKHVDYLWLVNTALCQEDIDQITRELSKVSKISLITVVPILDLNNDVEYLLEDIEEHMINVLEKNNPKRNKLLKSK